MLKHSGVLLWVIAAGLATAQRGYSFAACKDPFPVNWIESAGAVRFFHQPNDNNYLHVPLLFRSVDDRDVRLGTAPVTDYGRTVYLSKGEMRHLEEKMGRLALFWCVSRKVEDLERSVNLRSHRGMDVKIVFEAGTADSQIEPDRICDTLASMDSAITTHRALWEFQLYRIGFHCAVPQFKGDAYPDRLP